MTYNVFVILFAFSLCSTSIICCIISTLIKRRKYPQYYKTYTACYNEFIKVMIGLFLVALVLIAPFAKIASEIVEYKARPDFMFSTKEYDLATMYEEFESQPELYDCMKYELKHTDYYRYNGTANYVDSITIYKQMFTNKLRVVYECHIPSDKAEQQRIQYENMQEISANSEIKKETDGED